MDIKEFVTQSAKTAIYPNRGAFGGLTYVVTGCAGEMGECMEVLKKIIRDNEGLIDDEGMKRIKKEVGDVLWYWSQILFETQSIFADPQDADELQDKLFKKYVGEEAKPDFTSENLIFQQIFFLSPSYRVLANLFDNYSKIRKEGDFKVYAPVMATAAIELFQILCIFLANLDVKISEVMQGNLDKLSARKKAGKLQGSGEEIDER